MARIDLRENEYMEKFVGQDHIDSNDIQFWYQLLSCSFNFMKVQDPKVVEKTLDPYLVRLALSNAESSNIGSLIRVFFDRVSRIKSLSGQSTNSYYVFQSFNALYLIRSICKSYIETLGEEQLIKSFKARVDNVVSTESPSTPQAVLMPDPAQQPPDQFQQPNSEHVPVDEQQGNGPAIDQTTQTILESEQALNTNSEQAKEDPVPDANQKIEYTNGVSMLEQLISTLISILVDIPLSDSTYLLQVEAINSLLVLLSVQMYSATPAKLSVIYKCLMYKKCSIHALILTKILLNNFVKQEPVPQEAGSIIIGLASGLWRVLTLGYGGIQEEDEQESMPLLARQSLSLLNVLTNHYTSEKNPYREAIVSCQDSCFDLSNPLTAIEAAKNDAMATATTSKSILVLNSIKVDFSQLYQTICKYLHCDQVAPLLYLLLHSNKVFRPYILTTVSSNLDLLVLPLLKILYSSIEKGSHHVYMVLILFIILSEESSFNEAIHKIVIRGVPWYKDRLLSEISLGSLTALIIIRSFQYNTFRIKDKFLHSNLFATLANLSNHFRNLHPYVCQRIVDLLERLSKRYLSISKPSTQNKPTGQTLDILDSNNPLAKALATDTLKSGFQDASFIELDSTTDNNEAIIQQNGSDITIGMPDRPISQFEPPNVQSPGNQSADNIIETSNLDSNLNSHKPPADHVNIAIDDGQQDVNLIEEVIRMMLEVINNSLATQLKSNPDLIYTLLYKRGVFNSLLSSHQSFYSMVINVERILTFFYNKIEAYERQLGVEEIKQLIQETSGGWNFDQIRDPNARLLFRYVEDEQPEEFFIPYIWTRIYYSSGIAWNSKRIILFNTDDL